MNDTNPAPQSNLAAAEQPMRPPSGAVLHEPMPDASAELWRPTHVGQLFYLVMPNGYKMLARVTEISGPLQWEATSAEPADMLALTGDEPYCNFKSDDPSKGVTAR